VSRFGERVRRTVLKRSRQMAKREAFRETRQLKTAAMLPMGNGHATPEKAPAIKGLRDCFGGDIAMSPPKQ
jgi:hypothetical protein